MSFLDMVTQTWLRFILDTAFCEQKIFTFLPFGMKKG